MNRRVALIVVVLLMLLLLLGWLTLKWYCQRHPQSGLCHGVCPYFAACPNPCKDTTSCTIAPCRPGDICFPTVKEPLKEKAHESDLGYIAGEAEAQGGEIRLPSGPGSFDVADGVVAIADPVHLRVVIDRLDGPTGPIHLMTIPTRFPAARVRLKGKQLLIQQYEAPSDGDLVCEDLTDITVAISPCEDLGRPNIEDAEVERLRSLQYSIIARIPPPPSPIQDRDKLAGWQYLGDDSSKSNYYVVQYNPQAVANGGSFHFRKYLTDGHLADESPALPEENNVRVRDRARVDTNGVCYWLSVSGNGQPSTALHVWRSNQ